MPSTRDQVKLGAEVSEVVGSIDVEQGAEELAAAGEAARATVALAAVGSADVARGQDKLVAADALAGLSDVAADKGWRDVASGSLTPAAP